MNSKRLNRLKRRLEDLLSATANVKRIKLENLAKSLGLRREKRGKEPTYVSDDFPYLSALSIPSHREINKFTAKDIAGQLGVYVSAWEEKLRKNQAKVKGKGKNDENVE
jgi:hypothetical protein